MSSSSSSASSSTQDDNNNATIGVADPGPSRRRRTNDFEAPSSSRQRRSMYEPLPPDFIETLAIQVAIDAARNFGPLAAAPALSNVFQVINIFFSLLVLFVFWEAFLFASLLNIYKW